MISYIVLAIYKYDHESWWNSVFSHNYTDGEPWITAVPVYTVSSVTPGNITILVLVHGDIVLFKLY